MSFLSPWFLLASAAVAVPVFLHLFHKRKTLRISFPALRYLERTEREHAHEIRFRQILLLLARITAIALLVLAGARPLIPGPDTAHPPTAVAIVLDNSMSSGLVVGDERRLDRLKAIAERSLDAGGPDDVFWVLRAGEPWLPAVVGSVEDARTAVRATEVSAARGDVTAALRRAVDLVGAASLEHREIHLVSDLQATAFDLSEPGPAGSVPVVVWAPDGDPPPNRALVELLVGSGLPPVEGQRADLSVRLSEGPEDAESIGVRALLDGRIRAAGTAPPGAVATLPLPSTGTGWVAGVVESDPDALSLDDRRYFAFRSRPPPTVHVAGEPGRFAREALGVLEDALRLQSVGAGEDAELRVSVGAAGLSEGPTAGSYFVVPPADPTLLPALDVRLRSAGVPWRLRAQVASGGAELSGPSLPPGLSGVSVDSWYALEPTGEASTPSRVLAEVAGEPWLVESRTATGEPVLLLASPLDATSSSLPVSAGLVRFLDWAAGGWTGRGSSGSELLAGQPLPAPAGATHVVLPAGDTLAVDGTRTVTATGSVGHYGFLASDSIVSWVAVNSAPAESDLSRLEDDELERAVGENVTLVSSEPAWTRSVFRERTGPEIWWPLLILAALVLLVESRLAAAGTQSPKPTRTSNDTVPAHGAS
ncbi:MAG: BatA and WFA domain-containing protein [Gemmatimonadota bacterium]